MKRFFNNYPPLFLLTFISIILSISACHDDEDFIIPDESNKKITVKKLSHKEIIKHTDVYNKVLRMNINHNITGRNPNQSFNVNLSKALYITDGNIETYTFPIQSIDSLTKYNLMLSLKNGEYQPYIVHYDLTDEEYNAYLEGNLLGLSDKTTVSILQNNEISITDKSNPELNGCFQLLTVSEDCTHSQCQDEHEVYGFCGHPDEYLEIHYIPCVTGGGGNGGNYSPPSAPSGPGSPRGGGTYGGPSESDGSSVGYTGFVIGDGGTGSQDDVDAINQVTQEMDAAFGVGNWSFDNHRNKTTLNFSSVDEIISFLDDDNHISYYEVETEDVPNQNHPTKLTKFKIHFQYTPFTLELIVKSKLKTQTNDYKIVEISSKLRPFEFTTEYEIIGYEHSIENNIVTINVHGEMRYGLDIIGLDATIPETMNFQIQLNITSGQATSLSTLSNNFFD